MSERYFGRYYRLVIKPPRGGVTVFETKEGEPAMDIKFDVSYARGQLAREGTVSILGLSVETIHDILSLSAMARGHAMSALATLTLEVGYFSAAGTIEILNGYIWYGSVTAPPNMWLTLKIAEYNPLGGVVAQITCDKDVKLNEFLSYVCTQFTEAEKDAGASNLEIVWLDLTQNQVVQKGEITVTYQFSEMITLQDCIRKLSKELTNEVQFLLRTYSGESADGYRVIEVLDKPEDLVTDGTIEVNGDRGLLSVSGIDCTSGDVTTFIDEQGGNDNLCHLSLKSELNPQANGRYCILRKQYIGHYLGQEWYIKYHCSGKEGSENSSN